MSAFRKAKSNEDIEKTVQNLIENQVDVLVWQNIESLDKKNKLNAQINDFKIVSKKVYITFFSEENLMQEFDTNQVIFLGEMNDSSILLKGKIHQSSQYTYQLLLEKPTLLKELRSEKRMCLFNKNIKTEICLTETKKQTSKIESARLESLSRKGAGILISTSKSSKFQQDTHLMINSVNEKELTTPIEARIVYTSISKYANAIGGSMVQVGLEFNNPIELDTLSEILLTEA